MVGNGDLHLKHVYQGMQEAFGLSERKVKDRADRQSRLDRDVRVGALAARLAAGSGPPGTDGVVGKPDGEVAASA